MREAGGALALDPSSGAAELLGRLMLEPPREVPRDVERRLGEVIARRTKARSFLPVYAVSLVLAPLFVWLGLTSAGGIATYCIALASNIAISYRVVVQAHALDPATCISRRSQTREPTQDRRARSPR